MILSKKENIKRTKKMEKKINKLHKTFYMDKTVLNKLDSISQRALKKQVDILQELINEKFDSLKDEAIVKKVETQSQANIVELGWIATQMNNKIDDFKLEIISEMRNLHHENNNLKKDIEGQESEIQIQKNKKVAYAQEAKTKTDEIEKLKDTLDELKYRITSHNDRAGFTGKKIDIDDLKI